MGNYFILWLESRVFTQPGPEAVGLLINYLLLLHTKKRNIQLEIKLCCYRLKPDITFNYLSGLIFNYKQTVLNVVFIVIKQETLFIRIYDPRRR